MNATRRAASAALLCAALTLGVTACGSSTAKTAAADPALQTGAAAPSTAPAATSAPAAAVSADALAVKAAADLRAAASVHMTGKGKDSGSTVRFDLYLVPGHGCKGTISMGGKGSLELVLIGKKVWVKPDTAFWHSAGGNDPAVLNHLVGKYLASTAASKGLGSSFSDMCDVTGSKGPFSVDGLTGLTRSAGTLHGKKVVKLHSAADSVTMIVSDAAKPQILQVVTTGSDASTLDFSAYNAKVTLTAPPKSQTLDAAKYGM
ncbi:hypothetical protein [Streptacidiphilus sp. PAMC 29251]